MHIISKRRLREFWENHASAKKPLETWYTHVKHVQWQNPRELKEDFPLADQVQRLTIFNIGGNNYRLIVRIEYELQKVYIRSILTHAEYNSDRWKNDPWYN
jgi:mRNA interferase HigB